jgi:hypothetical protein
MSRKKLIVAYLFLVGAPLLGLLGILRTGQRLAAPASVGGSWNLNADLTLLTDAACRQLLSTVNTPFFTIAQSGPRLAFTLNNPQQTILPGTIRQNAVSMGVETFGGAADPAPNCARPQAIRLQGVLSQQGQQRALAGTLTIAGCSGCAPVPFRAVRLTPPVKDGQ